MNFNTVQPTANKLFLRKHIFSPHCPSLQKSFHVQFKSFISSTLPHHLFQCFPATKKGNQTILKTEYGYYGYKYASLPSTFFTTHCYDKSRMLIRLFYTTVFVWLKSEIYYKENNKFIQPKQNGQRPASTTTIPASHPQAIPSFTWHTSTSTLLRLLYFTTYRNTASSIIIYAIIQSTANFSNSC